MAQLSKFESRVAKLTCRPADYYNFISDLRNFSQFIPDDIVKSWKADENFCSFSFSGLGEVTLKTTGKTPFTSVIFSGTVLLTIGFTLQSVISKGEEGLTEVKLLMEADLNPMLKMFASGPVENFLETLVIEMEKFDNWNQRK